MKVIQRREFLQKSLAGSAVVATAGVSRRNILAQPEESEKKFLKSLKFGMVDVEMSVMEKFRLLKDLGFDGVELNGPSDLDQREVLEARDRLSFPIPGVIDSVHWRKPLSHPDPLVRAEGVAGLRTALKDAKTYGATTVLLVPAVVNEDVPYDVAYRRSQAEIRKVLPLAEELEVKIAIENVWNQFLLSPMEAAQYIDEFESPWIGAYFDVGNIVNFGWPEHWIRVLGHRIFKLDIKEYSREIRDERGPRAGFRVPLGEGDVNWPKVREALDSIGYQGWTSAEVRGGDRARLQEISQRMNTVLGLV